MRADFKIVLDACVLAPASLCDLLLRLAESPRLFAPRWSAHILEEVRRTQIEKLGFPEDLADSWREAVGRHFPEALVTGYEPLIHSMQNDEKDRHVLAAAVRCGAEVIVTSNLRDFPADSLEPWDVQAQHPSEFLINLYTMDSGIVVSKLNDIARDRGRMPQECLAKLSKSVPAFANHVAKDLDWQIG